MMPLASVTLTLAPMSLHDPKSQFVPHFDHLDIRNVMVLVTMSSASCNADTGTNGVT